MPTPIPPSTSPQSPVTTNAPSVESAAPAVTPEKSAPQTPKEDPKAAAKNAEASKQQARGKKSENVMQEQVVKNDLANLVPDKDKNAGSGQTAKGAKQTSSVPPKATKTGSGYGWEDLGRDVGHATVGAAKTSKPEKAPEDPKAAARAAQGSKQHAKEQMREQSRRAQIVQAKTESLYESAKQVAEFVAVKMPAAAKATGEAVAEFGADSIRRQGVEQLSKRQFPQDIVRGQMFEVEDIGRGSTNELETRKNTASGTKEIVATMKSHKGPMKDLKNFDHPKAYRQATQSGLEERLTDLNSGGPLTDFEKKVVSEWGKPDRLGTLTPIKGLDSTGEKLDKEVQAYKVTTPHSGNRTITYYDRNGNMLKSMNAEPALIDRNLGPLDWYPVAQLGAQLGKHLVAKGGQMVAEKLAAREAASLAKAETAVGSRSVDPKASTQPQAVPAPQAAAPQPAAPQPQTVPPNAGTMADNSIPPANLKGRPGIEPGWTPTRPGSNGTSLAPWKTDGQMFPIKTPKGTENITGLEYRLRNAEAQGWISKNHKPRWVGDGPSPKLYKQAEEIFGLNDGWWATWNPMRKKMGGAF